MMDDANTTYEYANENHVEVTMNQPDPLQIWSFGFCFINMILFAITLFFIVMTWTLVKAWRQFKNYIFLNAILSLSLLNMSNMAYFGSWPCFNHKVDLLYKLSMASFANWLLIMCMVIYMKIVKVFSGTLQHKYLKANIFAWGMSIIEGLFSTYVVWPSLIYVTHAMTYVILGFYISILYALLKLVTVRMVSNNNTCQILRIFIYVSSAFFILILIQCLHYFPDSYDYIYLIICALEVIFMASFLSMKMHREMWDEFWKRHNHTIDEIRTMT